MALGYVIALRDARLTEIVTAIGASGLLRIYSGTRPATGGAETTVLAELTLSATAGTVDAAALTFSAIGSDTNTVAGTASWARLTTSGGAAVVDMSAGEAADSPDLEFDNKSFTSGGTAAVSALVINEPNA